MAIDRDQLWADTVLRLYVAFRADETRTNPDEDVAYALADAPAIVAAIGDEIDRRQKARMDAEITAALAKPAPAVEPLPDPEPRESFFGRKKGKK